MTYPYTHLPIDEARRAKWERGRSQHRASPDEPFRGDPLKELDEELLDAMSYCEEAERRGIDMGDTAAVIRRLCEANRERISRRTPCVIE